MKTKQSHTPGLIIAWKSKYELNFEQTKHVRDSAISIGVSLAKSVCDVEHEGLSVMEAIDEVERRLRSEIRQAAHELLAMKGHCKSKNKSKVA